MTIPKDSNTYLRHSILREEAVSELDSGNLSTTSGWVLPVDTLALLYKLSSDPDRASDALKLLYELQTHQVELELQYRQLVANEKFIKHQLNKFKKLLDLSAIGYLMVDADGLIFEINMAASTLLNVDNKAVIGEPIVQFFGSYAQARLRQLFKKLAESEDDNDSDVACLLSSQNHGGSKKHLKITASLSIAENALLMSIVESSPSQTI